MKIKEVVFAVVWQSNCGQNEQRISKYYTRYHDALNHYTIYSPMYSSSWCDGKLYVMGFDLSNGWKTIDFKE